VDQDELVKDVLSADDSRLISRLLIPLNQKQQVESYQEAVDISVLNEGYPAPVLPNQDHATRIMVLVGYLHKQMVTGAHPDPIAVQRIQQHLAQHFQILQQTQPQAARQIYQQIQGLEQASGQAPGALPPQGNGAPPSTNGTGTEQQKVTDSISMKLADFYPTERAQVLAQIGIKGASPQEIMVTEQARAQLKQASVKPKIDGGME
jgi:hypothetical protein